MNREELIQKLEDLRFMCVKSSSTTAFDNAIKALKTTSIPAWYIMNYVLDETGFKLNCTTGA